MKATVDYVERKFEEFNHNIFGGKLPKLPIVLTDEAGALGKCRFMEHRLDDGSKVYDRFSLEINTRIDLPEEVVEDTIIHEMIHYFILLHNLNDSSAHGDIFKAVMQSINSTHGRKISITHNATAEEREQAVSTKRTWHVIAAVYLKNGETGVKVLPRVVNKIISYYKAVGDLKNVERVELYLHDNPFFNRYPTSGSFKIHSIPQDLLEQNLSDARRLRINGNQVVEVD